MPSAELQRDWEVIRYQTPASEREKRFEALSAKAHKVTETYPGPQRAADLGGHHRQLLGRREGRHRRLEPGQAGQGRLRAGDPDRRQGARRLGLQQPGRAVLQGAGLAAGLRRQGQGQGAAAEGAGAQPATASTRTSSTPSTWSRPSRPTRPCPISRRRCRRRRGPAARSPTPAGARRPARCWRRSSRTEPRWEADDSMDEFEDVSVFVARLPMTPKADGDGDALATSALRLRKWCLASIALRMARCAPTC